MQADYKIVVRDAVDLFFDKSPDYKSMVNDVFEDGTLLIPIPSYLGVLMPLRLGQEISMAFYRQSGRYVVGVRVKDIREIKAMKFAIIEIVSEPVKEQRRNFFRLPVSLRARIYPYPGEEQVSVRLRNLDPGVLIEDARTYNISISGIALKTKNEYKIGSKYLLMVNLNWPNEGAPPLTTCAEVKRVGFEPADETYQIGFHFIEMGENESERIAKYILAQQQKQIRQKRLIEGE